MHYHRGTRRHHRERLIRQRQFYWGRTGRPGSVSEADSPSFRGWTPALAGKVARTPNPCSCWMCRSPRDGNQASGLTRQEQRMLLNLNDSMTIADSD